MILTPAISTSATNKLRGTVTMWWALAATTPQSGGMSIPSGTFTSRHNEAHPWGESYLRLAGQQADLCFQHSRLPLQCLLDLAAAEAETGVHSGTTRPMHRTCQVFARAPVSGTGVRTAAAELPSRTN